MAGRDVKVDLYLRHIRDLDERWRQLQEMANPKARFVEELQRTTALMRGDSLFTALDASLGPSVARFFEQEAQAREQIAQMNVHYAAAWNPSPVGVMRDLTRQMESWHQFIEPFGGLAAVVSQELRGLDTAFTAWNLSANNLIPRLEELGLLETHAALARRIAQPLQVFTDFAADTRRLLEGAPSPAVANALSMSLTFAEEQCVSATDAIASVLAVSPAPQRLERRREPQSPYAQRVELIAHAEDVDPGSIQHCERLSPARTAALLANSVIRKIGQCNELRLERAQEPLFRTTDRMMVSSSNLTVSCPADIRAFADFVDDLYFLFHEGAGERRLSENGGGVLKDSEAEVVAAITTLRTWFRHDPDRGGHDRNPRFSNRLHGVFRSLGLEHQPVSPNDFRAAHRRLIEQVNDLLDVILSRLT